MIPPFSKSCKGWQKVVYNLFANSNTTPPEYNFKKCEWRSCFHVEFSLRCCRPLTSLGHLGAKSFPSGAQIFKTMNNIFYQRGRKIFLRGASPALLSLVTEKGKVLLWRSICIASFATWKRISEMSTFPPQENFLRTPMATRKIWPGPLNAPPSTTWIHSRCIQPLVY